MTTPQQPPQESLADHSATLNVPGWAYPLVCVLSAVLSMLGAMPIILLYDLLSLGTSGKAPVAGLELRGALAGAGLGVLCGWIWVRMLKRSRFRDGWLLRAVCWGAALGAVSSLLLHLQFAFLAARTPDAALPWGLPFGLAAGAALGLVCGGILRAAARPAAKEQSP